MWLLLFFRCLIYFAVTGILSFIIGRILPKNIFRFDSFPFSPFAFEKDGKIYKKIHIEKWQSHVPDISRVFKKIMPPKKISGIPDGEKFLLMIRETCISESVHFFLIFSGIGYIFLWPGIWGRICFYISAFSNLVFMVIQRYNRPRLVSAYRKRCIAKKENFRCVS